jgi:two-component system sensor histidine kinase FlrB
MNKMSEKEDLKLLKKTFEDFIKTSSELQNSYEALKDRSGRLSLFLSNILDNIKSSILVIDNDDNIILWNNLSKEIFPVLEGKDPPLDIKMIDENSFELSKFIKEKQDIIEVEVPTSNGSKWFEVQASDFINSNREKIGYIVLINDKTELKELQIRSLQEDRLRVMGELAAEVAHEIRNPLGSIELMVSLLQDDMDEESKQGGILKRIRSSVNNMNHTVTNILLYTKNIRLKKSSFSISNLLEESKNMVMMTIVKKGINLNVEKGEMKIIADFELLKQSIGNILLNAAESVDKNGNISIGFKVRRNQIVIEIQDDGKGISKEVQDKIFNPFFTTKNTGTGLGLAMVKRIVEAHGGSINFTSNDKGTLFNIIIPIK